MRALERTGEVRAAAADAGIDWSTAYARRRAHEEFAAAWGEALGAHRWRVAEEERRSLDELGTNGGPLSPFSIAESPSPARGEGLFIAGSQLKRVNAARWTQAAENRFFAALADTANVKLAAEAAGFSTAAIYARRLRHPVFREKWAAAVETGRARLELALIEMATNAIESGVEGTPDAPPGISISEALQILKIGAEPRIATNAAGRRILNAGAAANRRVASDEEVCDALAKRLRAFAGRAAKADEEAGVVRPIAETPSRE